MTPYKKNSIPNRAPAWFDVGFSMLSGRSKRAPGGTFFHNNNDLDEGFRRTADTPEYIYVLGFSPQKLDGKFHKLKVTLKNPEKLTVQARQGYYAFKATANP